MTTLSVAHVGRDTVRLVRDGTTYLVEYDGNKQQCWSLSMAKREFRERIQEAKRYWS